MNFNRKQIENFEIFFDRCFLKKLFFCSNQHFFDRIEVIFVVKMRGFVVIFGKAETDTLSSGIISTKFVMNWGYAITSKNKHRHWTCREQCKIGSFVIKTD